MSASWRGTGPVRHSLVLIVRLCSLKKGIAFDCLRVESEHVMGRRRWLRVDRLVLVVVLLVLLGELSEGRSAHYHTSDTKQHTGNHIKFT